MHNRFDTAQQFWCASAATAAVCFLAPRPLRALLPLGIGYFIYRFSRDGFPWADCDIQTGSCSWQAMDEYHPAGSRDAVDESVDESFPASDPPSYSPGAAAPGL